MNFKFFFNIPTFNFIFYSIFLQKNRINFLESENERYKTLNFHLSRRISMLELALKQERYNN